MKGRKPKPTSLKLITGNPGKRALNTNEPKSGRPGNLRAPSGLSSGAKRCWRQVAKQLQDAQILTQLDKPALALFCEAFARWTQANEQIQRFGAIVKATSGYPIPSPYLSIANKSFDQMLKLMAEFGMTPSSRARVSKVKEARQANDPWARF